VDFLDVLESERALLSAQDNVAQSDRRLSQNLVRLYKALGGGWDASEQRAAELVSSERGS
jgi:outer membrane protein TolC